MLNSKRVDVETLSKHWEFSPGIDTGIAQIYTADVDKSFSYTRIKAEGGRTWRFEGTRLRMNLRSDTTLAVQFYDDGGALKTFLFVALASDVNDLIAQELARREEHFLNLYNAGPVFSSTNYGQLTLSEDGHFTWTGYTLLVPQVISVLALGGGTLNMGVFLGSGVSSLYDSGLAFLFQETSGRSRPVYFMYTIDSQGLRVEYVPPESVDGATITRRAYSPTVIYFFKSGTPTLDPSSADPQHPERPLTGAPDMPTLDLPALESYVPLPAPPSPAEQSAGAALETWLWSEPPSVELETTPLPQEKTRSGQETLTPPGFNMDF
jgi:hypothetical protein